jgi:bacteriocin-like protein
MRKQLNVRFGEFSDKIHIGMKITDFCLSDGIDNMAIRICRIRSVSDRLTDNELASISGGDGRPGGRTRV